MQFKNTAGTHVLFILLSMCTLSMPIAIDRISVVISECEGGFWRSHQGGAPASKAKEEEKGAEGLLHIVIDEGMIRFDRIEDGLPATHCRVTPFSIPYPQQGSRVCCIVLTDILGTSVKTPDWLLLVFHSLMVWNWTAFLVKHAHFFFFWFVVSKLDSRFNSDGLVLLWKYCLLARAGLLSEACRISGPFRILFCSRL